MASYYIPRTCERFKSLVTDRSLWIKVEAREDPLDDEKIEFCLNNVNENTTQMCLAANRRSKLIFTKELATKFPNIRVLALENQLLLGNLVCTFLAFDLTYKFLI